MPKKTDELDDLIETLTRAREALRAAPARGAILDTRFWNWYDGPRTTALAEIEKVLGA